MKVGMLVHVSFKDHCFTKGGATPPLVCDLVGWVTHEDSESVVIAPWVANKDINDENNDTYTILKHPGMKVTHLRHNFGVFSK